MECAICTEPCEDDIRELECHHIFHEVCIDAWIRYNPTCPNCRASIPSIQDQIEIHLREQNFGFRTPATICIVGRRRSGKTTLAAHVQRSLRNIDVQLAYCGSPRAADEWCSILPEEMVYTTANVDLAHRLYERNVNKCIVIDDATPRFFTSEPMKLIMDVCRHVGITVVITSPSINYIPPAVRMNLDHIVVTNIPIISEVDYLYIHYIKEQCMTSRSFHQIIGAMHRMNRPLWIDNVVMNPLYRLSFIDI